MLVTDYPVFASALWVIVLFVFVLQAGEFIGASFADGGTRAVAREGEALAVPTAVALRLCVFCSLLALAGAVYFAFWSLGRFDLPISPLSFISLGHLWSVQRYEYGELEPWAMRLTTMWVYPAALLGGICFANDTNWKKRIGAALPFVPALLVGSIEAARLRNRRLKGDAM
jgi:hypothetical protein